MKLSENGVLICGFAKPNNSWLGRQYLFQSDDYDPKTDVEETRALLVGQDIIEFMASKMHADETEIDAALVRGLLEAQFPKRAELPLKEILPAGTDNAMFKLGNELAVRVPRTQRAARNIEKECHWLPRLAAKLPLAIPSPVAQGKPGRDYPWTWAITRLLAGTNLSEGALDDLNQAAADMGNFVLALREIDASGGPASKRGLPLSSRDKETRDAIDQLKGVIDTDKALHFWAEALATPIWQGAPRWIHGDLHPGNLLVEDDRLSAVVDFGSCGVGDPAADLMFAWTVLDGESRERFRSLLGPDAATWARGRGWAFTMGIVAYPYYKKTNPTFAAVAKRAMDEALADF